MSDDQDLHSPERVIAFSDAVVAIAITLMLLPLASLNLPPNGSLITMLQENAFTLGALTLSWVIIATFWLAHHRMFDGIVAVDGAMLWLNFAWLFAIAVMPLPTNIVMEDNLSPVTMGFYIGWMTLVSLLLTLMTWHAWRTPGLMSPKSRETEGSREGLYRGMLTTGVFAFAFLVALVVPSIAPYLLFLNAAVDPLARKLARR